MFFAEVFFFRIFFLRTASPKTIQWSSNYLYWDRFQGALAGKSSYWPQTGRCWANGCFYWQEYAISMSWI
jgi:hypothetical protein